MQIGVARNPPLEHAFGQSLRHLAHNNRRSRVERRSAPSNWLNYWKSDMNGQIARKHLMRHSGSIVNQLVAFDP